jgi:hypothetical protein
MLFMKTSNKSSALIIHKPGGKVSKKCQESRVVGMASCTDSMSLNTNLQVVGEYRVNRLDFPSSTAVQIRRERDSPRTNENACAFNLIDKSSELPLRIDEVLILGVIHLLFFDDADEPFGSAILPDRTDLGHADLNATAM